MAPLNGSGMLFVAKRKVYMYYIVEKNTNWIVRKGDSLTHSQSL